MKQVGEKGLEGREGNLSVMGWLGQDARGCE